VLQLINAQKPGTREVLAFSHADQRLVESLASQAAIALNNRLLMTQLETDRRFNHMGPSITPWKRPQSA